LPRALAPVRFARMAGSSIAAPGASWWVTDFLNAAYYARPADEREIADLRLAHGVITTRWARLTRRQRLGALDVLALNRAFGRDRLRLRGRLDRDALLAGSAQLLGDWFPEAWADESRRAHGIAFPDRESREAFEPERRLRRAALRALTPPIRPVAEQHWATYEPVALPDPRAALAVLSDPSRWPDIGCASGRFTALRAGGLLGQTFEIEVVADPIARAPIQTRGYVTCTTIALEGDQLDGAVAAIEDGYHAALGAGSEPLLPIGAKPLGVVVLTTHDGHFLGRARSQLVVWRDERGGWIRDVGAWDPLPLHLAAAYKSAGRAAQQMFWGPVPPERSMLAQLAAYSATAG
jgi:hypothetical protein